MEIQVRTDRHLGGREDLVSFIGFEIVAGLGPCAPRIASASVQVSVERGAGDLRCLLEVRPTGLAPVAVTHWAATTDTAIRGAIDDMRHLLERMFRRADGRRAGAATSG